MRSHCFMLLTIAISVPFMLFSMSEAVWRSFERVSIIIWSYIDITSLTSLSESS